MPAKVKDELQKKYLYDSVVFQVMFFSKIFLNKGTALRDHFEEKFLEI